MALVDAFQIAPTELMRLPGLIAGLHASIAAGHDDARLCHLAVPLHVLGRQTYLKIMRASDDLRLVAASLANDAARRRDHPVSVGLVAFGLGGVLLASGSFALAEEIVRRAGVTAGVDAELAGMLALSTSLTAAADKRSTDAETALDYAADLAQCTGEGNRFSLSFGPTNVTLWRLAAALEGRDYERAVALAETVTSERIRASARQAGYWMDYGRALARGPSPGRRGCRAAPSRDDLTGRNGAPPVRPGGARRAAGPVATGRIRPGTAGNGLPGGSTGITPPGGGVQPCRRRLPADRPWLDP